jgi:hypothetical protein
LINALAALFKQEEESKTRSAEETTARQAQLAHLRELQVMLPDEEAADVQ